MGLMTGLAIAGTALSGASTISGISQTNKAKKALDSLEVPQHNNPHKDIRVSTMGSDLIREEGQRRTANILDVLQGGDVRNVLSALPSLVATNNQLNQQAALEIDKQMLDREYAIANYEGRLNELEENRYQRELDGIGAMYNAGQQQMWNGINSTITSLGSLGRAIEYDKSGDTDLLKR